MIFPEIADLGLIGDRRTAAVIGRDATVYWYSPHRFDAPSIFPALLDCEKGSWRVELPDGAPASRSYVEESGVLETQLSAPSGRLTITDWMTMGGNAKPGLFCRSFSRAPDHVRIVFEAWEDNGRCRNLPAVVSGSAVFGDGLHLHASHRLRATATGIEWILPKGQTGWTVLADAPCSKPSSQDLERWKDATLARWRTLAETSTYEGAYRDHVHASMRMVRLLVYEPTGAIVAAATCGLPEVIGGKRNYDYRYSWLRDTGMIVRAWLRIAERAREGEHFLRFVARSSAHAQHRPLDPVIAVDRCPTPQETEPPLAGYRDSHPIRVGNRAGKQLQLGSFGNVLLAAAMIYEKRQERHHWEIVQRVADFLVAHWQEPDAGLWESPTPRQYTASKVFAACGLKAIAPFADEARQASYHATIEAIRRYVAENCMTREGAFAAFAGFQGVDISASLFSVWSYCPSDSPAMDETLRVLHRDYEYKNGLFRREDETAESRCEGAFLPGTFWISHYWTQRGDRERARFYLEAGLSHANDLGLLPEEIDVESGRALGNVPLGMTHASFLNAVYEFSAAFETPETCSPEF